MRNDVIIMVEQKDLQAVLKDALAKDNVLIGSRQVMKAMKIRKPELVVLASNCMESVKKDIHHYANISGTRVENFSGTAKQLGVLCGKPYSIASLAVVQKK